MAALMRALVIKGAAGLLVALLGCPLAAESPDPTAGENEAEHTLEIRYPRLGEEYGQTRSNYFLELLRLALDKSGRDYRLTPVTLANFRESRSVMSVAKGVYDVHWMNTNPHRETVLRPIRVPLYRGLIGWRVLLVREKDLGQFSGMDSLEPLKELKAVQGHDWPDGRILREQGLKVMTTPNWEGMFRMLYAGRVDYFPRSVIEVWDELSTFDSLGLAVVPEVVLHYPAAYYFFVRQEDKELADVIERGLLRAIEDGSFDRVLMAHFGDDVERAQLESRRVISLDNPLLTPQTPLDREELWYQP